MLRATPWLASDQAGSHECEDHLVDGGRGDAEMALHIGLGRRASEYARIGVDEGQILALLFGGRRVPPNF